MIRGPKGTVVHLGSASRAATSGPSRSPGTSFVIEAAYARGAVLSPRARRATATSTCRASTAAKATASAPPATTCRGSSASSRSARSPASSWICAATAAASSATRSRSAVASSIRDRSSRSRTPAASGRSSPTRRSTQFDGAVVVLVDGSARRRRRSSPPRSRTTGGPSSSAPGRPTARVRCRRSSIWTASPAARSSSRPQVHLRAVLPDRRLVDAARRRHAGHPPAGSRRLLRVGRALAPARAAVVADRGRRLRAVVGDVEAGGAGPAQRRRGGQGADLRRGHRHDRAAADLPRRHPGPAGPGGLGEATPGPAGGDRRGVADLATGSPRFKVELIRRSVHHRDGRPARVARSMTGWPGGGPGGARSVDRGVPLRPRRHDQVTCPRPRQDARRASPMQAGCSTARRPPGHHQDEEGARTMTTSSTPSGATPISAVTRRDAALRSIRRRTRTRRSRGRASPS